MATWPAKTDYATGDVLSATNMNDIGNGLNDLYGESFTNNFYAGKNKIINGDFGINQRAFTSNTTTALFNFDRWFQSNSGGTFTVTPQTFTAGAAPVTGYEGKTFLQGIVATQSAASDYAWFGQKIESVRTLAGQTAVISFWAKATTGTPKIAVELAQNFGTGGSAAVNTYAGQVTLSTSWARYSVSVAVPSISGKTIGTANDDNLRLNLMLSAGTDYNARSGSLGVQNNTFGIWGVQVETGSTATPFQTATGTIQGELAACQRYYWRATGGIAYSNYAMGFGSSTTNIWFQIKTPVTMRINPSSVDYSNLAWWAGVGVTSISSLYVSGSYSGLDAVVVGATTTGTTAGTVYGLLNNNNTAGYVGLSAEL